MSPSRGGDADNPEGWMTTPRSIGDASELPKNFPGVSLCLVDTKLATSSVISVQSNVGGTLSCLLSLT